MTIYSSDYNERTAEMARDREQRIRETALMAAAQAVPHESLKREGQNRAAITVVHAAQRFEHYIRTGENRDY